jgi:hypothetical protein
MGPFVGYIVGNNTGVVPYVILRHAAPSRHLEI